MTDWSFVRDDDAAVLSTPIDWIGENYYTVMRVAEPDGGGQPTRSARTRQHVPRQPAGDLRAAPAPDRHGLGDPPRGHRAGPPAGHRRPAGRADLDLRERRSPCDETSTTTGVHDPIRTAYIEDHIRAVLRARDKGFDVRGYYAWSLLDNLEWASGWTMKFGIVRVDPQTGERTPKDSALWYRDLLAARG